MDFTGIIVSLMAFGIVIGSVMLIKHSATKFNLTEEQKEKIAERKKELEKEEMKEDE